VENPTLMGICIYNNILRDPIVKSYVSLDEALEEKMSPEDICGRYGEFLSQLVHKTELSPSTIVADAWRNHLMDLVIQDENTFTRKAEYIPLNKMSAGLIKLAKHDIRILQEVLFVSLEEISSKVNRCLKQHGIGFGFPCVGDSFQPLCPGSDSDSLVKIKKHLAASPDWRQCLNLLAEYARTNGCGEFGRYLAFRWVPGKGLAGVSSPDPVKLEDLIRYERQREEVVANTRRFVQGYPANNVLLYGDRGTGKSSTVKGLIHEFGRDGLRLVEVSREGFRDFPEIMAVLEERPQRFIIFIDDLSFEEYETEYKSLKAVMEGGIQSQPENVLIYATSNRKHLVKETFGDRTGPGGGGVEVHPGDGKEEKISLADRFGLVVTFLRPDQKTYLDIVRGLAEKEGIAFEGEELESLALKWEMLHNGRSGRTARQFIQDLLGRTHMGEDI
jgi:predicted AAA+ superfamily ATPase